MTDAKSYNSRAIALDAIMMITCEDKFTHVIINSVMDKYSYIPRNDRSLITRLIHGTIEYMIQSDYVIKRYSKVKIEKIKPVILAILRMSIYQIMHMDRIPDRAVCDEAVKLTCARGLSGLKGYVNGMLRTIIREKDNIVFNSLSLEYSMPEWITNMYVDQYGTDITKNILSSYMEIKPLCTRVNKSIRSVEEVKKGLLDQGVNVEDSELFDDILYISGFDSIVTLDEWKNGSICLQDLSSSCVCRCAELDSSDLVLDMCSAPGGKSLHAADMMKDKGSITACDVSNDKINLIDSQIKRIGYHSIKTMVSDATIYNPEWKEHFDTVIADLPCSGLGIIGSKPDIRLHASQKSCEDLIQLQRNIIDNAVLYVKPGGTLIYSTCTLNKNENEGNREYILNNYSDYYSQDISSYLPDSLEATPTKKLGYITIFPKETNDGFFVSVYKRK